MIVRIPVPVHPLDTEYHVRIFKFSLWTSTFILTIIYFIPITSLVVEIGTSDRLGELMVSTVKQRKE